MKNLMRSAPAEIHSAKQRMPAILHSEDISAWLAGSADDARSAEAVSGGLDGRVADQLKGEQSEE
jgi:putative SOS response-associated peptidase YedK